jgi:hypothetical protein
LFEIVKHARTLCYIIPSRHCLVMFAKIDANLIAIFGAKRPFVEQNEEIRIILRLMDGTILLFRIGSNL